MNFALRQTALLLMPLTMGTCLHSAEPPQAERRPHTSSVHGVEWTDDYFWLRDRDDPAVRTYLEAENAYLESRLAPLKPLREALVAEMKARIIDEDTSVPYRRGGWLYYSRDVADREHPLICRKPWKSDDPADLLAEPQPGEEVVILDLNERAGDSTAYSYGGGSVSPDGRYYAWKENHDGTDRYLLRIRDLDGGKILDDLIEGSVYQEAPVWALDNRTLFYTVGDETNRAWQVRRYRLGTPVADDSVVFEESDTRFSVSIEATRSRRHLLIDSQTKDTTETSRLGLDRPDDAPEVFLPRRDGIRYGLADCAGHWFILTNDGAVNGRLFKTPIDRPGRESWQEVLPGDESIAYGSVSAFNDCIVLGARRDGVPGFFLLPPDGTDASPRWVTSPTEGGWVSLEPTPESTATAQRFSYATLLQPYTVAEADLKTGEIRVLKRTPSPPGFDASRYRVERTLATAEDGAKIPIWLLLRADHPMDGSGGLLLEGYGAYGMSNDPWFDSNIFSLVDRGVGFAVAQVRGGGEFGRPWYEAGKLAAKERTFADYIACAEHLVAEGYTSIRQLVGTGGSAGGLLVGAVLNQRPDLFAGFVANVPFVDVLNTMLDPTLPLTTGEYDEWGDPASSREVFDRIRAYSPYDNVAALPYPPILALAGWNDTRVAYWEPAKWIARLRTQSTGTVPPLLFTAFETGHGGASGRYSYLDEVALQYAFILETLGRVE